jgi:hypothetical protein
MSDESSTNPEDWPREKIPPALLEWIKRNTNEEEILAGIREIRETGGFQLEDFIHEIEEKVKSRE